VIPSLRIVLIVVALAAAQAAQADECADAVNDYNAVLPRLNDATQRFNTCIADSKGMDDCSAAFRRLRAAHDEFSSAVAVYVKQCR
jgi:hypothetical protein